MATAATTDEEVMIKRTPIYVSSDIFSELEKGILKSYPNACVLWMEQIDNPTLEENYAKQRAEIEEKRGQSCSELLLYHGTSELAVNNIIQNGFRPSMNARSAYGKGTYFAKNASYSRDYAPPTSDQISFMLLCSVLVGNVSVYSHNQIVQTKQHDNSVDHIQNPTIYVTPYQYGAIPRYLIAFYRNAK